MSYFARQRAVCIYLHCNFQRVNLSAGHQGQRSWGSDALWASPGPDVARISARSGTGPFWETRQSDLVQSSTIAWDRSVFQSLETVLNIAHTHTHTTTSSLKHRNTHILLAVQRSINDTHAFYFLSQM